MRVADDADGAIVVLTDVLAGNQNPQCSPYQLSISAVNSDHSEESDMRNKCRHALALHQMRVQNCRGFE